jgi:ABC-type dipeptide/oligopeptide/nickel transport system permease subunit
VLPTIIVIATTGLSTVIPTEASLSFLGLGVLNRLGDAVRDLLDPRLKGG